MALGGKIQLGGMLQNVALACACSNQRLLEWVELELPFFFFLTESNSKSKLACEHYRGHPPSYQEFWNFTPVHLCSAWCSKATFQYFKPTCLEELGSVRKLGFRLALLKQRQTNQPRKTTLHRNPNQTLRILSSFSILVWVWPLNSYWRYCSFTWTSQKIFSVFLYI